MNLFSPHWLLATATALILLCCDHWSVTAASADTLGNDAVKADSASPRGLRWLVIDGDPEPPPFEVTAQVGGNLGSGPARLGEYTFDKMWNGAAAYTNGNYILFYDGADDGWQWVTGYNSWAGDGPLLSDVPNAQAYVEYNQFQLGAATDPTYLHWTIDFAAVYANFTVSSVEELILSYKVGKNRQENVLPLLKKDCKSNITDTNLLVSTHMTAAIPENSTHKTLVVKHNFNKTLIGGSDVYDAASNKLEVCQIIQLVTDNREMIIIEDKRNIVVTFDLDFNYDISNISLAEAIVKNESKSVDINSYVQVCKCYSEGTGCDTTNDPLKPNTDLHVCIYSSSADVLIDKLDSMDVKQDSTSFSVIENNVVTYPSFTSREYIPAARMVKVSTRLPLDIITFSNTETVDIGGRIVMKLADSSERKLQADNADSIAEVNEATSFDLVVALDAGFDYEDHGVVSSGMFASNGLGGIVLLFSLACMVW